MIRHMFAGGNTPNGFFSYFDNILPLCDSRKTIYLKGGSGTGKSTFMKKAGEMYEKRGFDVEYFHCSNDIGSLDGVCIPKLNAAIIDATAPHAQDPVIPAAADEILNVAACLNSKGLRPHADELRQILTEKQQLIKMAYGYIRAAYSVYINTSSIYEKAFNKAALNKVIYNVIKSTFSNSEPSDITGRHRKLFASAVTPAGFVNFSEYLFNYENLTVIYGTEGLGGDILLDKILEEASAKGLRTEGYYSPLSPYRLEHLIIPDLETCFVTSNNYHVNKVKASKEIDLYELCNKGCIESYSENIQYNQVMFDELANKGMNLLKESGVLHNKVEELYIANMDFDKLNGMYDEVIRELSELE